MNSRRGLPSRALTAATYNRVISLDELPSCPSYLPDDVRDEFHKIVLDLEKLKPGLASRADRIALIVFARTMAMYNAVSDEMMRRPLHTRSLHGELKVSPYMTVFMQLNTQVLRMCSHFGLTPFSRQRMLAPPKPTADEDRTDEDREVDALFG